MEVGSDGARLSFTVHDRIGTETRFKVRYRDPEFAGEVIASDFLVGRPTELFAAMAREWRGWTGDMTWAEHEDRLSLAATSDGRGHVTLVVTMRRQMPESLLVGEVKIDAGELDRIARGMEKLFDR